MDILDSKSYRLLKKLYRKRNCYISIPNDSREFICIHMYVYQEYSGIDGDGFSIGTGRYKINDNGITFILKHRKMLVIKLIPYIITTAIAVCALIISIFKT